MNKLVYTCTTKDGSIKKVNTFNEAEAIKENGGFYKVSYEPINKAFKVAPNRYEKLKGKF